MRSLSGSADGRQRAIELEYDIVVNGGSFAAPAAAFAAARANPTAHILVVEPTAWLGGQATAQGVAAIDNPWHEPGASLMRNNPELYYPADYLDFLDRIKNAPPAAPGEGFAPNGSAWVTREAFDPRTAAWALDEMAGPFPNIDVLRLAVIKSVETVESTDTWGQATAITSLTVIQRAPAGGYSPFDRFLSEEIADWYDPEDSAEFTKTVFSIVPRQPATGMVVVDAGELADAVVLSGAAYTVGRESTTEVIGDDGSLPAMDEDGSQAFVYPFCMTDVAAPDPENELKTPFPGFDAYYAGQETGYFSLGSFSWNRVWTYRRLKNTGPLWSFDTVNAGDVSMQNWYPGNDYPYGTMYKNKTDAAAEAADWQGGVVVPALAEAEMHAVAWYFFMKDRRTTAWDTRLARASDTLNMMGTAHGLAMHPYIRGTRRIVGLHNFRITERYFVDTQAADYDGGPSFRYYDSVGIGNYAADIHPSQAGTGISPTIHRPAPFYIPFRALGSANVRNLLAAGKRMAQTYISNSAYRLHPIEWASGSAAGTAAALMQAGDLSNYDLLDESNLRALQAATNTNAPISWAAYDAEPIPAQNGEIVVNDFRRVEEGAPFVVEVYHHRAVRARVFLDGVFVGETTYRANGRLVLNVPTAPTGAYRFSALCYDGSGLVLDELTTFGDEDLSVVDNEDPRCTLSGSWTRGTAQPNKYGPSYDYSWGGTGADTATWELYVPHSGRYVVSTWYPEAFNRATDAPFTVVHADGETTIPLNQQEQGGTWVVLGEFRFRAAEGGRVILSNDIENPALLVVADAVRAEPLPNASTSLELY